MPKDQYYQYFSVELTNSVANAATQAIVNLPIPRIPNANKATIIELLWMDIYPFEESTTSSMNAKLCAVMVSTSSSIIDVNQIIPYALRGNTIAMWWSQTRPAGTFAQGMTETHDVIPHRVDFQDKTGKGFLVAADNIYCSMQTANFAGTGHVGLRLFYRFVEVSTQEYVGIIQAQTSGV